MSLSLITDRSISDLTALYALRNKIKSRTATVAEWSEWLDGSKGSYNATDLNRVGQAIQYLADLLNSYGYSVTISPKTDWTISDIPRESDMTLYLADLEALKAAFYGTVTLPGSMDNLTPETANDIEKPLLEIETYINRMVAGFRKCGTFKCGQGEVILP